MDKRHLPNYLKIELSQQSVQGSESEYVNNNIGGEGGVGQKRKGTHRQNALWMEGKSFAHLQKLTLAIRFSLSLQ